MFRSVLRFAVPAALLALVGLTVPSAAAVIDPLPIEPNQHFVGLVNGDAANATIRTDCVLPSATGHPVPGQYVEAQLNSPVSGADTGFTGTAAHSLDVSLAFPTSSSSTTVTIGTLSGYNIELAIPATITVPCSGSGVVAFAPTPTSLSAKSATVKVTLVATNG